MNFILFIVYLLLFGWLVLKTPFFRKAGIPAGWLLGIYFTKVFVGMAYGKMFTLLPHFQQNADTWRFFFDSIQEKEWLLRDPGGWLADLWQPRYASDGGVLSTHNSLFNDLKDMVFVKLLVLFNLLSGSRYFVNLIFFNYIGLFGLVGLARVWALCFTGTSTKWFFVAITLWPSVLFWSSGLHRDGLLLHCLGWVCWLTCIAWQRRKANWWLVVGWLLHAGLIFIFRNYIVVFALAGVAVARVIWLWQGKAAWRLAAMTMAAFTFIFVAGLLYPSLALPQLLAQRQQEFLTLEGASGLKALPLNGSWISLVKQVPAALYRSLFVPFEGLNTRTTDWPFALENIAWILSLIPAIWYIRKQNLSRGSIAFLAGATVLALLTLLLIGLTIPFGTAIVRYRSLIWPFMLPVVIHWWLSLAKKQKPDWQW